MYIYLIFSMLYINIYILYYLYYIYINILYNITNIIGR